DGGDGASARRLFRGIRGTLLDRMNELVSQIVRAVPDPELQRILDEAWVFRRFDVAALRHLLGDDAEAAGRDAERRYLDHLDRLQKYSFVDVEDPGPDGKVWYRFHDYLREARDSYLARDGERYSKLHDRARAYYSGRLKDYEEKPVAYGSWYRYEHREWRALKIEWIYHGERLRSVTGDRTPVRLDFVRLFLDAFWWWGMYQYFPFCQQ